MAQPRKSPYPVTDRPTKSAVPMRSIADRRAGLPSYFLLPTVVLVIASLYFARAILIPIVLSILLTFFLTPVASALERIGLRRIPAVILIAILAFSLLAGIGWLVTLQFTSVANELPTYRYNIREKIADIRGASKGGALEKVQETAEEVKEELKKDESGKDAKSTPREVVVQAEESSTFWPVPVATAPLLERLAGAGLVIVLVIFMLIQREDLRNRFIRLVGYRSLTATTKALEEAAQRISRYLLMQSLINASFGISVAIALFFIGLPFSLLWGFLATVLRFIPYVGPWAAAIMPIALSLAVFDGWLWPLVVVAVFVILELVNNMILEPLLYSESAGVSEIGLLIAVAFWTWLWGPVGLLLATPLTVCVVVISKYVPQLEFISILMTDEPAMQAKIRYYQRLLAMDQDEATEIIEEHLKTHPAEKIYDDLLIPALHSMKRDYDLGRLTDTDRASVLQATREILDSIEQLISEQDSTGAGSLKAGAEAVSAASAATLRVIGCPVRDETDELALLMLQKLVDPSRFDLKLIGNQTLTAEVIAHIAEENPAMICIASLPPGGVTQTRYLCKRLRAQFPHLKILIGRWSGQTADSADSLKSAGADRVSAAIVETRDQMIQMSQIDPG